MTLNQLFASTPRREATGWNAFHPVAGISIRWITSPAVNEARKSGKRAGRQNGSDQRVIFAVELAQESKRRTPARTNHSGRSLLVAACGPVFTHRTPMRESELYTVSTGDLQTKGIKICPPICPLRAFAWATNIRTATKSTTPSSWATCSLKTALRKVVFGYRLSSANILATIKTNKSGPIQLLPASLQPFFR